MPLPQPCNASYPNALTSDRVITETPTPTYRPHQFSTSFPRAADKRALRSARDFPKLLAAIPQLVDELFGNGAQAAPFRLPSGETLKLAVMPLSARGVPESTADAMTQILSAELNQIAGIRVISRDDIRAMLDKVALEGELGCTDNLECIVEIGAALGLSKLVTGTVGRITETYVITMQLIDIRKANVDNRVLESFEGTPDKLKHAVKLSAYRLAGVDYEQRHGTHADWQTLPDSDRFRSGLRVATALQLTVQRCLWPASEQLVTQNASLSLGECVVADLAGSVIVDDQRFTRRAAAGDRVGVCPLPPFNAVERVAAERRRLMRLSKPRDHLLFRMDALLDVICMGGVELATDGGTRASRKQKR